MTYLLVCLLVMVQVKPVSADQRPEYTIYRVSTPISVDGQLDELVWVTAPDVGAFVYFPGTNRETRNRRRPRRCGTMKICMWRLSVKMHISGQSVQNGIRRWGRTIRWRCLLCPIRSGRRRILILR